jgi:hypothetical protein
VDILGFAIGCMGTTWWAKSLLVVVAAGVTIHLGKIKTWHQISYSPADQVNSMGSVEVY